MKTEPAFPQAWRDGSIEGFDGRLWRSDGPPRELAPVEEDILEWPFATSKNERPAEPPPPVGTKG